MQLDLVDLFCATFLDTLGELSHNFSPLFIARYDPKIFSLRLHIVVQVAQLSQRDRAADTWVSYGQQWKTATMEDNIYWYYKSIFNHCDVFGQQRNRIRWKRKKSYYAVQGHPRSPRSVPIESPFATSY